MQLPLLTFPTLAIQVIISWCSFASFNSNTPKMINLRLHTLNALCKAIHILMSLSVTLSTWVVHVHMAQYTYELVHVGILDALVHLLHVFDNYCIVQISIINNALLYVLLSSCVVYVDKSQLPCMSLAYDTSYIIRSSQLILTLSCISCIWSLLHE